MYRCKDKPFAFLLLQPFPFQKSKGVLIKSFSNLYLLFYVSSININDELRSLYSFFTPSKSILVRLTRFVLSFSFYITYIDNAQFSVVLLFLHRILFCQCHLDGFFRRSTYIVVKSTVPDLKSRIRIQWHATAIFQQESA